MVNKIVVQKPNGKKKCKQVAATVSLCDIFENILMEEMAQHLPENTSCLLLPCELTGFTSHSLDIVLNQPKTLCFTSFTSLKIETLIFQAWMDISSSFFKCL